MNSAPTSDAAPTERPALRRDRQRGMLLGVCAGVARSLDADPLIVRAVLIVVGLLAGPLAVVAYVAAAVIMPRDDGRMTLATQPPDQREMWIGWAGVGIATGLLIATGPVFDGFWDGDPVGTPLLAVALIAGVVVLYRANRDRQAADATVAATTTPVGPPTAPTEGVSAEQAPTATMPAVRTWAPRGSTPPAHSPSAPPAPKPSGPSIFLPVMGALIAVAAVATVIDAVGIADVSADAVAVLLAAGALVAGGAAALARTGMRGRVVTLLLGVVLAVSAAGTAILSDQFDDGVGARHIRPASAADIQPEYQLGLGLLDLDFRDVEFPAGVTTVKAHVGAGAIQLEVPDDVQIQPVGDTSTSGSSLAPITAPKEGRSAPILRIDADIDVGGSVDVSR